MNALPDIRDLARGRWPSILRALGVDEKYLKDSHGPCPICQGKDRFRFDDKEGGGSWFCSHCGAGSGVMLVMKLRELCFKDAAKLVREQVPTSTIGTIRQGASPEDVSKMVQRTWRGAVDSTLIDDVGRYLKSRYIALPHTRALRTHPRLEYRDQETRKVVGHYPAMLAAIQSGAGKLVALHRTWLKNGKKAPVDSPKKALGKYDATCAIRLMRHDGKLGVAEGVETALAAAVITGVPTWSLISSAQLERWQWPEDVTELIIFGDNDHSFTGAKAAYALAYRAKAKGLKIDVMMPDTPGTDWADMLKATRANGQ